MRPFRRDSAPPPPPVSDRENRDEGLRALRRLRIDYDEAGTAAERETYHTRRLVAPGEFMLDAHPVARLHRLRARLGRTKRSD